MATEDNFIVAIVLGSSKVTGIAGQKKPDGSIMVEAVAQEPSSQFIRRGTIYNLTRATQCVESIVSTLRERMKRSISQVYVGFGGQSVRSRFNTVSKPLAGEQPISAEDVNQLLVDNQNMELNNCVILDAIPQKYIAGKDMGMDPIGLISDRVEAHYLNIIAKSVLRTNIEACFRDAKIAIAGEMLIPVCEADFFLTEAEKRSGCVFVDFGADTTSVLIYRDNVLRYISVIPLGSANITKDIQSKQFDEQTAEHLKVTRGCAFNEDMTVEDGNEEFTKLPNGDSLSRKDFTIIVDARINEILVNVKQQIKESGYDKVTLISGAILTGGGSNLDGIEQAFAKVTQISQVKTIKTLPAVTFGKASGLKCREEQLVDAVSVLSFGTQNCCGPKTEGNTDIFGANGTNTDPEAVTKEPSTQPKDSKSEEPHPKGHSGFSKFVKKIKSISEKIVGDDDE